MLRVVRCYKSSQVFNYSELVLSDIHRQTIPERREQQANDSDQGENCRNVLHSPTQVGKGICSVCTPISSTIQVGVVSFILLNFGQPNQGCKSL